MIEYIIGGSRPTQYRLTPNSVPISAILFTEIYRTLIFHTFYEENTNNLCAIEIDNDIIIGTKYGKSRDLAIEFTKDIYYFDSMVFQQVIKQAADDKSLFWSNITYLEIVYQGKKYIMGERKPVGLVEKKDKQGVLLKYDFLEPIVVLNPFYISGFVTHNAGICAFQIVEMDEDEDLQVAQNEFLYHQGKFGILEAVSSKNGDFDLDPMIMDHQIVCYENMEPIQLLQTLYERMRLWTYGKSIYGTYYIKFIYFINKAMVKRDYETIHSILRLDRYLRSLIQRDITFHSRKKYQEDLGLTTKLYQVWSPLSETMKLIQKIHNGDLELNCYQIAYLSQDYVDVIYALITIMCQIGLIILLGLSLFEMDTSQIFPLYEGVVIIPIIFIFTTLVVSKQFTNTLTFYQTFPDMIHTFVGKCDLFSNVICACIIVLLNFCVLAFSDSLMDIVLNSLAALFIIELDDSMVFLSQDNKDDLFRQKCISVLNQKIKELPSIYFESSSWKHTSYYKMNEKYVYVDRKKCILCEKKKSEEEEKKEEKKEINIEIV